MAEQRTYTTEELAERSKDFHQLIKEALDQGDIEKARYWATRNEETKEYVHDMYLAWVPRLLSLVHERLGEEQFVSILRESVKSFIEPIVPIRERLREEGGWRAWMDFMVDVWRQHCGRFTLEEDDEKFTMTQRPCGSGGQMINRKIYDGIFGERRYRERGYHTFGKEGLPLYCGHCVWGHMVLPMKSTGEPLWVHDHENPFPKKPGDPCIHYFYKEPETIPDEYYEMVGMKKPGE
jgi:hypothetical protein